MTIKTDDLEKNIDEIKAKETEEKNKKLRIRNCQLAITKVLQTNNCIIDVSMVINSKGAFPQIQVIAK